MPDDDEQKEAYELVNTILKLLASALTVFFNSALRFVAKTLSRNEFYDTKSEEEGSVIRKMVVAYLVNTAVIRIMMNMHWYQW